MGPAKSRRGAKWRSHKTSSAAGEQQGETHPTVLRTAAARATHVRDNERTKNWGARAPPHKGSNNTRSNTCTGLCPHQARGGPTTPEPPPCTLPDLTTHHISQAAGGGGNGYPCGSGLDVVHRLEAARDLTAATGLAAAGGLVRTLRPGGWPQPDYGSRPVSRLPSDVLVTALNLLTTRGLTGFQLTAWERPRPCGSPQPGRAPRSALPGCTVP